MKPYEKKCDGLSRVILLGPPGTGKTTTALDDFLLPALQESTPERVLACSFSNAAADELRSRLQSCLGLDGSNAVMRETCTTIHSEALRRVRVMQPELRLYDAETDKVKSFKGNATPTTPETEAPSGATKAAITAWDMARALLVHEDENRVMELCYHYATRHRTYGRAVREQIDYIEQRKRDEDALDFTDMLLRALRSPPRISGLDLLLVDEAQDMTPLQWALIDHWSQTAQRVVIIGDADQCIHEWMGASYQQFISRVRSPAWHTFVLAQSWRVPLLPHAAARHIITQVRDREDAEYLPRAGTGSVEICGEDDVITRAREIVDEYVDADETFDGETVTEAETTSMFILCRTNRQVFATRKLLMQEGIPCSDEAPGPTRSFAPATAVRVKTAYDLCNGQQCPAANVASVLALLPAKDWFDGITKKAAIESLEPLATVSLADMSWLKRPQSPANWVDVMRLPGDPSYWTAIADRYGPWVLIQPPPIRVMTWHRSKGREADVVAIDARRDGAALFAPDAGLDDSELRVIYVAMTRTRDELLAYGFDGSPCYAAIHEAVRQASSQEVPF